MAKLYDVIEHTLNQDEAIERTKRLLEELKQQFADQIDDLKENWIGNTCRFSFSVMGFLTEGVITVHMSRVEISGKLPLAATPFKGKIKKTIRERAEALLS